MVCAISTHRRGFYIGTVRIQNLSELKIHEAHFKLLSVSYTPVSSIFALLYVWYSWILCVSTTLIPL